MSEVVDAHKLLSKIFCEVSFSHFHSACANSAERLPLSVSPNSYTRHDVILCSDSCAAGQQRAATAHVCRAAESRDFR